MTKLVSKNYLKHFWSEEQGLFSMFVLLCISNFLIIPFFSQGQALSLIVRTIWFLLLFAGISTLTKTRSQCTGS